MCYSKISLTSMPIAYLTFSQLDLTVRLNGIADYSPLERLLSLPHNLCFNQRYDLHTLLFFWFTQSLCIVTFAKKLNFSNISPKSYSIYQCSMKFDQNVFTWLNNTMLKVVKIKNPNGLQHHIRCRKQYKLKKGYNLSYILLKPCRNWF